MKNIGPWFARRGRGLVRLLCTLAVVGTAYAWAYAGHSEAVALLSAAKQQIARADWLAAVQSLDAALRADRYISFDAYWLCGTAINGAISTNVAFPPGHSLRDVMADIERFLGEARYQRGRGLTDLADAEQARAALAGAIPLLADPADALVADAFMAAMKFDYAKAAKLITLAIERHPLVPEYYEQRALYRTFLRDFRGSSLDNARAVRLRESPNAAALAEVQAREHDANDQPVTARQDTATIRAAIARLAGEWVVVLRDPDERTADDLAPRTLVFQFHDGELTIVRDGERDRYGSYRIEPDDAHQRVRIDLSHPLEGRETTILGIYDIRDDILRLCVADEGGSRPTAFISKGLFGVKLYTMKRTNR